MRTYRFVVGAGEAGLRLDRYLAQHLPTTISRMMIQRRVQTGAVAVNQRCAKAHQKVRGGEVVTARFDHLGAASSDVALVPQPIPIEVIFEDASLLVINKPAGLVTHPAPGHWDGTLVNAVLWHLQQRQGAGDAGRGNIQSPSSLAPRPSPLPRAGIVHRLDKDTSGLLIVAKTEAAHAALSRQLKRRTLGRRYLALVEGHVPLDHGTVNAPLGRHLTHRKEMTIRHLGGRSAITHYRVLKRYGAHRGQGAGDGGRGTTSSSTPHPPPARQSQLPGRARPTPPFPYTVLEVSLETGRTHQIRVHMSHLGYPVLGDTTYGKRPASVWQTLGIARQLLHAYAIRFLHPVTGRSMELKAPVPEDLRQWIDTARLD